VRERDLVGLDGVLDENVSLGAPPYWDKLHGRKLIHHLLGLIVHTIDGFTYHREWCNGSELALEFTGRVDERELQGIDLISLNDSFLVQNIDVLMRPVNSVIALRDAIAPQMAAFLSQGGDGNA
jgi:hypothetical protein